MEVNLIFPRERIPFEKIDSILAIKKDLERLVEMPPSKEGTVIRDIWIYYNGKISYEVQDFNKERSKILETKYFS
jgi:hypothetical protein